MTEQAAVESTHETCVKCGANDAMTIFENGWGYCHSSCGSVMVREPKPLKKPVSGAFEPIRGLTKETCEIYGIQTQRDEDGNIVRVALKWPSGSQYRRVKGDPLEGRQKYFFSEGSQISSKDLFGPKTGGGKRLYITEGGFDAASVYQALNGRYPAKSMPSAKSASSQKWLAAVTPELDLFEELVVVTDPDEAGQVALKALYSAFPQKVFFVKLPKYKDPNEYLVNKDSEDLKWSLLKPQKFSPENFLIGAENAIQALRTQNPYSYTQTGHSGLDHRLRGLVRGGLTFVKAPPGTGKTEFFRFLQKSLSDQDVKFALLHMEEMFSSTLRCMATYALNTNVRTAEDAVNNNVPEDAVEAAAVSVLKENIIFELLPTDDLFAVPEYIRMCAAVYGAKYVFLDHIQRLVYRGTMENPTADLTRLTVQIVELCKELDIGVIAVSHVSPEGYTKYAKSLEEEAIIVLELSRDKESEDEIEKMTTKMEVTKNRPFGFTGDAGGLLFNEETTVLTEC